MSLAETSVLAVELKLNGVTAFTSGITEAEAATAGLNKAVSSSGAGFTGMASKAGVVKQVIGGTTAAIEGMATHLKGVITGPLGLIGLGAGLFTVAGLLKQGTEEASSFGLEVSKLSALTGQSVEATSALASALDHFGISGDAAVRTVGMLTKNIGGIVNSKGGLAGFAATFGLALTDAHGNLVDINEEILRTADYFNNKSIPATEKAAALAKLYGRQWQTLIPFLTAGRQGIEDAEQAAKDLGLTLTTQNVSDLAKYRENFLTLGDAAKGLQLQLGLVLIPTLSDLARSFTTFLREGGTTKIVAGFKSVLQTAKDIGTVVTDTIIPTLQGLATTAKGFWDSIPAPLRDLLVKGIVADRTIHFLFGVSPLNLGKNLLGDILGPLAAKLTGGLFSRGSSPAAPLFVKDVGLPGTGSGGGGLTGALGGLGLFGALGLGAAGAGISKAVADFTNGQFSDAGIKTNFVGPGSAGDNPLLAALPFGIGGAIQDISEFLKANDAHQVMDTADRTADGIEGIRGNIEAGLHVNVTNAADIAAAINNTDVYSASAKARGFTFNPNAAPSTSLASRFKFLAGNESGSKDAAVATALAAHFESGSSPLYQSSKNIVATIKALKADQHQLLEHGDTKNAGIVKGAIGRLQAVLKEKNFSPTIVVKNATYFDGRLVQSNLERYLKTGGAHGSA